MRRKPKEKSVKLPYEITYYKPWFFWKKCCICGDEVRRETIYEISITWYTKKIDLDSGAICRSAPPTTDFYRFCSQCCISMEHAEDLFVKHWLPLYQ
jgi:hypothetical protein